MAEMSEDFKARFTMTVEALDQAMPNLGTRCGKVAVTIVHSIDPQLLDDEILSQLDDPERVACHAVQVSAAVTALEALSSVMTLIGDNVVAKGFDEMTDIQIAALWHRMFHLFANSTVLVAMVLRGTHGMPIGSVTVSGD